MVRLAVHAERFRKLYIHTFGLEKARGKDNLEALSVDGRIILR
jgi:hypothetical protein